jgi:type II secretory pathway component GspD/PulD (secretin)
MTNLNTDIIAAHTTHPRTFAFRRFAFIATAAACALQSPAWAQGAKPANPAGNSGGNAAVKPTEGQAVAETFTVQFQDTDILQALQMLSMQGRRNIVASKGVSGTVTANLFDVTVMEALDVLLRANDLRMEEAGNFIYVYTREEWEDIAQSRLKKSSRNFPLEYLNAKDAGEFIAPLLSEAGKVSFVGDVEKATLPKKAIDVHRVSVGDTVVSDSDVAANHVAKRNGLTGIGLEPAFLLYSTHLRHGLAY